MEAPDEMYEELKQSAKELSDIYYGGLNPEGTYWHQAGEVEARNVQARMHMTPAERKGMPPWRTLDVDPEDIDVRFSHGDEVNKMIRPQPQDLKGGGETVGLLKKPRK